MKHNEIGHFPYRKPAHQFDTGGYDRQDLAWEGDQIRWLPRWISLGEVDLVKVIPPQEFKWVRLLYDLQTAHDCYCADLNELDGVQYIYLQGSGWADSGFPFFDETFDPKKPFETGKGSYALIRGVAKDKFMQQCENGPLNFLSVTTGNVRDDFCLADFPDFIPPPPPA